MLRLLRTSRWIGFTALVIGAIIAFGLLSRWQWARAEAKHLEQQAVEIAGAGAARPLGAVAPEPWSAVTVTGVFDAATQVLVRQRPLEGQNGYWVLTALRPASGDPVWVNRGWLAATGPATTAPPAPAPPGGEVSITGWWRAPERARDTAALPAGMVAAVDPAVLPLAGSPAGFIQQRDDVDPALVAVPRPQPDAGRNISYAMQWLLFAAVALVGWWYFLRREAADDAARQGDEQADERGALTP
jgi:cytochrome oxidase assembly protein ShyY1